MNAWMPWKPDQADVTQHYCPKSGGRPGEDNTTHHLAPRGAGGGQRQQVCRYCGRTEKQLREEADALQRIRDIPWD